jgi:hypothetical protein
MDDDLACVKGTHEPLQLENIELYLAIAMFSIENVSSGVNCRPTGIEPLRGIALGQTQIGKSLRS